MRSLEDQIRSLADAAEAATPPIVFHPPVSARSSSRYVLVAAVLLLVGVGGLLLVARTRPSTVVADESERSAVVVGDPLGIDLGELASSSEQNRVSSVGEVLTLDFEALPEEWAVEQVLAGTTQDPEGVSYRQMVEVVMPEGIHLVVNVEGRLDGSEIGLARRDPAEETQIRGQPAQTTASSIEWIEQGRAHVSILGSELRSTEDELVMLAEALRPINQRLDWKVEIGSGRRVDPQIEPILAGVLGDLAWTVVPTGTDTDLFALVVNGREQGRTPYTTPSVPADVEIEIAGLPGGIVILGHAPPYVAEVVLRTNTEVATLPVVAHESGRSIFAVPIADAVDPTQIEFVDGAGQTLGTFPVDQYPAYLYGSIGTGIKLTSE